METQNVEETACTKGHVVRRQAIHSQHVRTEGTGFVDGQQFAEYMHID